MDSNDLVTESTDETFPCPLKSVCVAISKAGSISLQTRQMHLLRVTTEPSLSFLEQAGFPITRSSSTPQWHHSARGNSGEARRCRVPAGASNLRPAP